MATLLLDVETGHNEMIHDAQLDYYAKKLATCSSDTTIKVYDILSDQQWQHQSDLKGHDGPVWQVAWAHPKFGVVLASCSFDGKVIIHREQPAGQWQKIFVSHEFQSSANSIAWAPHEYDLCLACVSSDGQLCVLSHNSDDSWSVSRARVPNGLGLNAVSWAPYGVNQGRERRLVTGGCDNTVRIWYCTEENGQLSEWREEHQFDNEHSDWVRDVAWAPSIGLPCNTIASCSEDGKVVVWTQPDLSSNRWDKVVVRDTNGTPVWRVSWSITGSVLAVSAGDSDVTLWKESLDGNNWVQISDVNEDTFAQSQPALDDQQQQPDYQQPEYQQQDYQQQDYQQQDYQQQDYQQGSQQPHQDQGSYSGQQDFYGNYAQQGAPQQQFGHNPPAPPSGMQQGQQFGQSQFQQPSLQQAPSGFGGYPPQQGGQQQPPQMGFQQGPPGGAPPSQGFQQPPMNNGMPPQQQPPPHQGMYQQGMY